MERLYGKEEVGSGVEKEVMDQDGELFVRSLDLFLRAVMTFKGKRKTSTWSDLSFERIVLVAAWRRTGVDPSEGGRG